MTESKHSAGRAGAPDLTELQALHRELIERPEYRANVTAKGDDDSPEGSWLYAIIQAAEMLRTEARARGMTIGGEKLAPICMALANLIGRGAEYEAKHAVENAEAQRHRMILHGLIGPKLN